MSRFGIGLVMSMLGALVFAQSARASDCHAGSGCDPFGLVNECGNASCDERLPCDVACDSSGCDGCGACDGCSARMPSCLSEMKGSCLRRLKRSDHCFDDFISPTIDFVHFEDPRTLTELRPIFVTHEFPNALDSGSIQLFALQFRVALTERLSLIGVKDGYIVDNSEGALDPLLDSGWADISAGLKYNLIRDAELGRLLSGGFTYEIPLGSEQSLQAVGDGVFHLFVSGGQRLLDGNAHWLSSFGWQIPVDQSVQSTTVHWNNHFDVKLTQSLYLFTENSWWHWVDEADVGLPLGISGQDLLNVSATNVEGNDLVTHNVGAKFKPHGNFEAGIAYEFPLTEFKDIIEDRLTVDMIFRY
ncbi:MAG: hypothetical protein AAF989_14340 [Planctomycetota bacterium]